MIEIEFSAADIERLHYECFHRRRSAVSGLELPNRTWRPGQRQLAARGCHYEVSAPRKSAQLPRAAVSTNSGGILIGSDDMAHLFSEDTTINVSDACASSRAM
jgi:hypothetical protein